MKNQFVPYETAKALKELNLNQEIFEGDWYYVTMKDDTQKAFCWTSGEDKPYEFMNPIKAPLWQQIEEWLWEKHKIWISIKYSLGEYYYVAYRKRVEMVMHNDDNLLFSSPITAKHSAITSAIKHLLAGK